MPVNKTPQYNTMLFCDVYENEDEFIEDYNGLGIPTTISEQSATMTFYLLYSRFGNNPISNMDVNQFKMKLFTTVWQYGPSWEKKLDIQKRLRDLTEDELMAGAKTINNHSFNPSTEPSTGSLEELTTIDNQNTTSFKRSKIEAYAQLWALIKNDVTEEYVGRFLKLFKKFVSPENPLIYITQEDQ